MCICGLLLASVAGCGRPKVPERNEPLRAAALRPAPPAEEAAQAAAARGLSEGSGPFFFWQETPAGRLDWGALLPLATGWSQPGNRVTIVRPLGYLEDEGPGSIRWDFRALWPIVWATRNGESNRLHVFPIVWWDKRVDRSGGEPAAKTDWAVMPVLWGGSDTARGSYFAVFPVAGLLKGKLGTRWIRFAAFPLWVDYQSEFYHSWNVLWPVFGVWRGPDVRGWRVWPLYGIDARDGRYRRVFALWPFFHHWQLALDTPHPSETWVFFPFWMSYRGDQISYYSVLWPLFGRKHAWHKNNEFVEWHAPWPFVSWITGESVHGFKIFPFYGHRVGAYGESRQVLWPFYIRETGDEPPMRVTTVTSAFVFRYVRREWVEKTLDGRRVRVLPPLPPERRRLAAIREPGAYPEPPGRAERPIDPGDMRSDVNALFWPLFRYDRGPSGERFFTTLEPWWFRNRLAFDRVYGPFFTLYRHECFADGTLRDHALFNLFKHVRTPEGRNVRFFPLFDYSRRGSTGGPAAAPPPGETRQTAGESARRFRILGGLFGYERRAQARRVRILWIPIGRKPEGWDELPSPVVAAPSRDPVSMPPAPVWGSSAFRELLPVMPGAGDEGRGTGTEEAAPSTSSPAPGPQSPTPESRLEPQ